MTTTGAVCEARLHTNSMFCHLLAEGGLLSLPDVEMCSLYYVLNAITTLLIVMNDYKQKFDKQPDLADEPSMISASNSSKVLLAVKCDFR